MKGWILKYSAIIPCVANGDSIGLTTTHQQQRQPSAPLSQSCRRPLFNEATCEFFEKFHAHSAQKHRNEKDAPIFSDFLFSEARLLFLSKISLLSASAFGFQLLFRLVIPIESRRNNATRYCYANASLNMRIHLNRPWFKFAFVCKWSSAVDSAREQKGERLNSNLRDDLLSCRKFINCIPNTKKSNSSTQPRRTLILKNERGTKV